MLFSRGVIDEEADFDHVAQECIGFPSLFHYGRILSITFRVLPFCIF